MLEPRIMGLFRDKTMEKNVKVAAASLMIGGSLCAVSSIIYIFIDQAETTIVTETIFFIGLVASLPWFVIAVLHVSGIWGFVSNLRRELR